MGRLAFESKLVNDDDDEDPTQVLQHLLAPKADTARMVHLHSELTERSAAHVVAQLLHLSGISPAPIHMVISTYGGSVDEMFCIYDTIKFLPCPVQTVALGKVMSAGVLLLAAGVKGKRLIGASSRIMIHPMRGGTYGNVFEMENQATEAKRLQALMVECLARESKLTKDQLNKIMDPKVELYMTPEEVLKAGIADKIIGAT